MVRNEGIYLVTRYSPCLSGQDASTIIDWFMNDFGGREASKQLDISYKTMYDCKKPNSHPRDDTKQKILSKAWAVYPYKVLELLQNKTLNDYTDVYQYYLSYAYEYAVKSDQPTFPEALKTFNEVLEKLDDLYVGLDVENKSLLINKINSRARELGEAEIQPKIELMTPYEVADRFVKSIRQMKITEDSIKKISIDQGIPLVVIKQLADAYNRIEGSSPIYSAEAFRTIPNLGFDVFSREGNGDKTA